MLSFLVVCAHLFPSCCCNLLLLYYQQELSFMMMNGKDRCISKILLREMLGPQRNTNPNPTHCNTLECLEVLAGQFQQLVLTTFVSTLCKNRKWLHVSPPGTTSTSMAPLSWQSMVMDAHNRCARGSLNAPNLRIVLVILLFFSP